MRTAARAGWAVLLAALAACGDDGPTGPQTAEDVTFHPSLEIDLAQMTRLPSGVYVQTVAPGQGAQLGLTHEATLDYELWLPNGRQLSFGRSEDEPVADFLSGFSQGIVGMQVGEARKIVVPSELGYGAAGFGSVPPHAVLVYHVSLLSFR